VAQRPQAREALCTRAFIIVMVVTWFFEERGLLVRPDGRMLGASSAV
jgi:hypothetical protein